MSQTRPSPTVITLTWLLLLGNSTAQADLNIMLQEAPAGTTLTPIYDPNLNELGDIMQAAAAYWESIIKDDHTVTVTYGYADLPSAVHGIAEVTADDGLRATAGNVALDIETNSFGDWYFDQTPTNHSEFAMHQVLYRDLGTPAQGLYYDDSAPEVLEVGYWGNYVGSDLGRDALTTAVHELGHILGLAGNLPNFAAQIADGEYDFNIFYTHGINTAVNYHSADPQERVHVRSSDSAMAVGAGNGDRNLPGATDVFATASVANWLEIDLPRKDFWGNGQTNWNNSFNWPGARLPDDDDDVYVRNGSDAALTSSNGLAGNLFVREESTVSTGNRRLDVTNQITVEGGDPGAQANLVVNAGGRVVADEIELNEGGILTVTDGTPEEVTVDELDINPGGTLIGNGAVRINAILRNDGTISAIAGAGNELALLSGPVDLDGVNGDGEIFATLGDLRVSASTSDAFDGRMTIGAGREVEVFGSSWQVGQNAASDAEIFLNGGGTGDPARLVKTVGGMTFVGGTVDVSGHGVIDGPVTFEPGITTDVDASGRLRITGGATYRGGTHQGAGELVFDSATTVDEDTTLNVATVDLDGTSGTTQLSLASSVLTINADQIDAGNNRYDGTLQIDGQDAGLIVNLNNQSEAWRMDGVLNTSGGGGILPQTTLDGNPVEISGTMNMDGLSTIAAPMTVSGNITLADAATDLRLSGGPHIIQFTASITGPGEMRVGSSAHLIMQAGSVISTDIVTGGRFEVGESTSLATVNADFDQSSIGTLAMQLSDAPGVNQDLLQVTGVADLDGTLEVTVLDGPMPAIGPLYTLLSASNRVGAFSTLNVLSATIFQYEATLTYPGDLVALQFTDVTMFGDFNDDFVLNCTDIDALVAEIASGGGGAAFDLNGDSSVDHGDLDLWLAEAGEFNVGGAYLPGDANLDGFVNGADFVIWNANKFTNTASWCAGDFSADGVVNGVDFLLWNSHKFMASTDAHAVPEPKWSFLAFGLLWLVVRHACQANRSL